MKTMHPLAKPATTQLLLQLLLLLLLALACCTAATQLAGADLMDLYVQHMDEAMGTREYERAHQRLAGSLSHRRRVRSALESPTYQVANPVRQSIDAEAPVAKGKKKTPARKTEREEANFKDVDSYLLLKEKKRRDMKRGQPEVEPFNFGQVEKAPSARLIDETTLKRELKKGHNRRHYPKKYHLERKKDFFYRNKRWRRSASGFNSATVGDGRFGGDDGSGSHRFTRHERLDDEGEVILEWDPSNEENVTFRLTAKTLGYVGLGFNDKNHLTGADVVLAWVDDYSNIAVLLDSHGIEPENAAPETDASQDVHLLGGSQNATHTVVTFARRWQACDPHDRSLNGDTVRVLWALHERDPEYNSVSFHGEKRGGRALRLKAPGPHPPPVEEDPAMLKWDVKLNQFTVSNNSDTIYWCKIFKAPKLHVKHHMIGYLPLIEKSNEALVHHVTLYECSSTNSILAEHARLAGAHCYSPTMPREWDTCLQPVLAWARGSRGEWLPAHVGLPIAERGEHSYYMLEVHYNNRRSRRYVDSSGVRLYLTPKLRRMEAGVLVAGVAVSPMHMIPPRQGEYATAGYCTPQCTEKMFDENGINVVSVVLHSHLAGRRLSLRHIRHGRELPPIVQDRNFDFEYQQPHTLAEEARVLPGDELVAECVYDTRDRAKPTFGGYSAVQEMCLAFVVHYPRTPLAACYSMTPVKEFFNALNVQSFKGVTMEQVEKLFLSTTTDTVPLPVSPHHHTPLYPEIRSNEDIDVEIIKQTKSALISKGDYIDYDDIFGRLVIEKPDEFKDHTLSDHMLALAWNDTALSKSIERSLYHGKHVTFCRTRQDKIPQAASIQMFPNFTALPEANDTFCREMHSAYGSSTAAPALSRLLATASAVLLTVISMSLAS